ncbi:MAG: HAD family hydrolase [Halobacteriales archaeon]
MAVDDRRATDRSRYDFWLFDLDGTLVTIEDAYVQRTMAKVGDRLGTSFDPETARRIWYGRTGLRDAELRTAGVDPERFWSTFHRVESPADRAAATSLHPDAHVVNHLTGPRGLVTHCQPYLTEPILDRLGLGACFDAVVCCSDELGWKPDPAPVRLAMDALGVDGGRGVLVGDSRADVEAAANAGLDGILVARDGRVPPSTAARVVPSLDALR